MTKWTPWIQVLILMHQGAHGQVAFLSVMKQKQGQIPQRQGLCSSSGRTPARELCFGRTQQTKYPKSKPSSWETTRRICAVCLPRADIVPSAVTDRHFLSFVFILKCVNTSEIRVLSFFFFFTTSAFILSYSVKHVEQL